MLQLIVLEMNVYLNTVILAGTSEVEHVASPLSTGPPLTLKELSSTSTHNNTAPRALIWLFSPEFRGTGWGQSLESSG